MLNTTILLVYLTVMSLGAFFMARTLFRARKHIDYLYKQTFKLETLLNEVMLSEEKLFKDRISAIWSVKQVVIIVTADSYALTRDIVRGINQAITLVHETAFPPAFKGDQVSLPVTTNGIHVEVHRHICISPPGFFSNPAGRVFPEELKRGLSIPQDDGQRIVAVFAQVTKHRTPAELAACLKQAIERIEAGEHIAADYDDDNGYAFTVLNPLK